MIFRLLLVLTIIISACGVKGNPKPPPSFTPLPVENIYVKQYGNSSLVYFYYDKKYTDSNPIKEDVYFIIYKNEKRINPQIQSKENLYWFTDSFEGKENCYKVVVKTKRRESLPSKVVCISKKEVPNLQLNTPKIELVEEGFELYLPAVNYAKNIYKVHNKEEFIPTASYTIDSEKFTDQNVELDKEYCYYYTLSIYKSVETEKSPTVCSVFKDIFPPKPPKRGKIIVEGNQATIIWEESESKDMVGYLIYKNNTLLNNVPLKTYYFIDKDYKKTDTYKVIAVDKANNKSIPLEIKEDE
ncbi:hypothetical protein [Sulfurihydrogenibium subterraneum]|uniref:hypothetical protein n=1 Tax=Sulfurihydrogenibium subterraneum TaxID=171121 RepID=UPI000490A285|nr:hypothetical protein [Sulfurihydrogenibium subterraneum]